MTDFADQVARLCIQKYTNLSKNGKPSEKEWTVLSGIVLQQQNGLLSLVALATGTKCLGEVDLVNMELYEEGSRLHDSHAEVLTRRAFLRYLYEQIDLLFSGAGSDIFFLDEKKKINLKNGISFHFFTSQTPCGDCSIFPKENYIENGAPPNKIRKHDYNKVWDLITEPANNEKRQQNVVDIYRTGAKCVKSADDQDPHQPGIHYHVVGTLRTKPGRGNPTLSLSCSDKIAKWNILGLQGALLSMIIPLIKMETVIIGGGCPFSLSAMERGVYARFNKNIHKIKIVQSQVSFRQQKDDKRKQPCPSSIIWCAVRHRNTEIAVEGRRQGATKRKKGSILLVTRRALFETFLKTCDKSQNFDPCIRHPKKITYLDCKKWSKKYQTLWNMLKVESFHGWTTKPIHLQKFVL
ncbi:tRNA-specific adenosine deaminase 1 isoform X1 [Megalopta genalis]|uniref:tRNA-specific adenosine deaminase 1 isoform X1 n=1 Tax=Megalopta genalis TaxID=115081 RepID=UPI001442F5D7|nr:tRNA-specific adenosine deaminase 1 isoform X1 [Megalopta genalis]